MDRLRPRSEPARSIYDAFQKEAQLRPTRTWNESESAEREVVWKAACEYATKNGLREPTFEEILKAERCALGHFDYATTWAHGVARLLQS